MSSSPAANAGGAKPPYNWPAIVMFGLTTGLMLTVLPLYAWHHDFSAAAWVWFAVFLYFSGLSITGGYHRLWSHKAYQAHWGLRLFYAAFGAQALQNSVLVWASMHRVHHREVDHETLDPYSSRRGLWYSHMGWMLRDEQSHKLDFGNVRDLEKDPIVAFQHKHYLGVALFMNIAVPLLAGWATGDPWGTLVLAGLVRLVVNHHFTFLINSLAHFWGRQPYTTENSARDNDFLAVLTYGEGYHNFHHLFQWDYRNGIRWWQWDPTKWLIASMSWLGLASNLRRTPEFQIQRAKLQRHFEKARERLAKAESGDRVAHLQLLLEHELQSFSATLSEWARLQQEKFEHAKQQLTEHWETSEVRRRIQHLEDSLRQQQKRVRLLSLQVA
ncbi:Fatty acid desaturase [Hydrocarboniphaga effusa AP103]|jgi:stearoyl-CoA desaturase (delta-9 desaturase)|uniref:Fatty acid desaturase n=2 Tax=Nevskiaceae TaxID=568386 RepID=I8TB64_9GAMM|nr:Fatty acid desaturase [Hydrocarboniphaga effusa AP103]